MIKDIDLALEVKTFFTNSTPMMDLSIESSPQKPEFPLTVINGIARR
jgi:hypothetical protein